MLLNLISNFCRIMNVDIKVSRLYLTLLFCAGLWICTEYNKVLGIIFVVKSITGFFVKVKIVSKDAKYSGIFRRTSIKDIESISCYGFFIFNRVVIYGRGTNKISLFFVNNFNKVFKYAESIENFK